MQAASFKAPQTSSQDTAKSPQDGSQPSEEDNLFVEGGRRGPLSTGLRCRQWWSHQVLGTYCSNPRLSLVGSSKDLLPASDAVQTVGAQEGQLLQRSTNLASMQPMLSKTAADSFGLGRIASACWTLAAPLSCAECSVSAL